MFEVKCSSFKSRYKYNNFLALNNMYYCKCELDPRFIPPCFKSVVSQCFRIGSIVYGY